jgi:hypothetical protein
MGFLTGLSEGLTYVLERKAEKEAKEQDRAYQTEMYQQQLRDGRMDSLFKVALERGAFAQSAANNTHELSVLRQLGASDEMLEMVAGYSTESLQEAVTTLQEKRKAREGSPLTVGPAEVDAFLSTAVNTVSEGGDPDYNKAAALLGLDPEDLDKPFAGGMTYEDILKGALGTQRTGKTTFLDTYTGKPLTGTDVTNILTGAREGLEDSLKAEIVATSRVARGFAAKAAAKTLTDREKTQNNIIIAKQRALAEAEEDLKNGSVTAAIQLVGGQAIMPLLQTNSAALNYNFGQGWVSSINKYTFSSNEDLQKAVDEHRVNPGDLVVVNGVIGTAIDRPRTQ